MGCLCKGCFKCAFDELHILELEACEQFIHRSESACVTDA